MDAQSGTKALNEAVKRMGTAHELEPTDRGFHWDLIRVELDLWKEQLKLKMPVPDLESAAPHLPELDGLLGNENSHDRLWSMSSQLIGPLTGMLRDQKRLPEATTLMRHIIALRQRMEVLEGWPKYLANLSFGARVSLIGLLTEQKLTAEADAERNAMLADVEKSGSPLVQTEVHARLWSWLNSLGKHDEAEAEARVAHTIALKNNLGWRTMQYASDLGTTLDKEDKLEEAEKLLLETWAQTSKQAWPDENVRLRADLANRIAALYHGMHMKQPETARDDAARVWVARAAEPFPLEKISNGYDLDFAAPLWMGWLAQLVDEGKVEEYKKQRSALIGKAKDLKSGTNAERVTTPSLLLPLAGDELKLGRVLKLYKQGKWCSRRNGITSKLSVGGAQAGPCYKSHRFLNTRRKNLLP